jgi:hypothetical protein
MFTTSVDSPVTEIAVGAVIVRSRRVKTKFGEEWIEMELIELEPVTEIPVGQAAETAVLQVRV